MPTSSTKPGWLPVVGGPCDGYEFYGADHLAAGTRVIVPVHSVMNGGFILPKDLRGSYSVGLNRDRIEWQKD
jgi:hypothetical protein